MLQRLIAFAIKNSTVVLIIAGLVLFAAGYKLSEMPVDIFPELNAPTVLIMSEAGGFSAGEVEQYVTFPIESAVNGLPGVRRVRSKSSLSLSMVWAEFDWGTDIYRARQLVAERLALAEERIPETVHTEIAPVTSITGEIMLLSISSPEGKATDLELRSYAEFNLRNHLLSVPGVSQVVAIGGEFPEYQVNVRPDILLLYNLTIKDVVEAAAQSHSIESAGYLPNVGGEELPIRQTGQVQSVEDIRSTIIKYEGDTAVTIGQVADVKMAGAPKRGAAAQGGKPAVVMSVQKVPGANTLEVTKAIDRALDEIEMGMPPGIVLNRHVVRQSDFINLGVKNVIEVTRDAAIFVIIILIIFLFNFRTTLITLMAIPISIATALLTIWALGLTINVMTLGGLAVAIGTLVDDAIIGVENVFKRLKQNRALPEGERLPHETVVLEASNEIRKPIVFATLIILIVFVPLFFLSGLEGRFFKPLGIAYILTVLASLFVALTVTVAMCKLLLRKNLGNITKEGFVVRHAKTFYLRALSSSMRRRKTVITTAFVLTLASLLLAGTFGTSFLPEFNEGTLTVFVNSPPGTSLMESDRLARGLDERLLHIEGVRAVVRRTGRAEGDEHAAPVCNSEIEIAIKPGYKKNVVRRDIDKVIKDMPGLTTMIGQPIEHRLSVLLSGTPAAIAIKVYGEDLATLRQIAREIEAELKELPGARDVTATREVLTKTIPITYRSGDLGRWGLTPASAAEQVSAAFNGVLVAEVNQGIRRYNIAVRLDPEERREIQQIKDLVLRGIGGAMVRLSEVADVGYEQTPYLISRENARRMALISCNVAEGYNLGHLIEDVQRRINPIVHDHGYSVVYGGQFEAQRSASRTLYLMGSAAVIIILLILHSALGSLKAALLVMVNLPLALIGGIIALYFTGSQNVVLNTFALFGLGGHYVAPVISIASMVGFVTIFGIATRNGILLVNQYLSLSEKGYSVSKAIEQGSMDRLVPILMTACTSGLGLLPIAMAAGEPGSELLAPLAIVGLGGLISSTLLNLIVVPVGYSLIFKGEISHESSDSSDKPLMTKVNA